MNSRDVFGGGPYVRQQFAHGYPASSLAFTNENAEGNCIIVAVSYSRSNAPVVINSVTDSNGNAYNRLFQGSAYYQGTMLEIWAALGIKTGNNTVTLNISGGTDDPNSGDMGLTIAEYSGVAFVSALTSATSDPLVLPASIPLSVGNTVMFFVAWASEGTDDIVTVTLLPNSVLATTISTDNNHKDAQYDLTNYGCGFNSGSYIFSLNAIGFQGTSVLAVIALR